MGCNSSKPVKKPAVVKNTINEVKKPSPVPNQATNVKTNVQNTDININNVWKRNTELEKPDSGNGEAIAMLYSESDGDRARIRITDELLDHNLVGKIIPESELNNYQSAYVYGKV